MKNFFTLTLCFLTLSLTAQETITYPYNPDANSDQFVAVSDVLETIAIYGSDYFPSEIMVGDTTLSNWIQILNQTLANQQAVIDSLQASLDSQETQLDSTMIADMISAAGGLGSGGGCDYAFPEGLDGDHINIDLTDDNEYVVPSGKNLYVISIIQQDWVDVIQISGLEIYKGLGLFNATYKQKSDHLFQPIVATEGDVISSSTNNYATITGLLVDKQIDVFNFELEGTLMGGNVTYNVPDGKRLIILNVYTNGQSLYANGNTILSGAYNYYSQGNTTNEGLQSLSVPLIFPSNTSLSIQMGQMSLNGYLVDEDYFADCGGGGSSDGGSNNDEYGVSQYGDTLFLPNGNYLIIPNLSQSNLNYIFNDYGEVTDVDGNVYKTLVYGENEWMVQNLKTQIGDFNTVADHPGGFQSYADSVGYYYSLSSVIDNVCPSAWHVATLSDWQDLHYEIYGTTMNPGGYTNSSSGYADNNYQILWSNYQEGTNQSAFNLFRTGYWSNGGAYITSEPESTHFWCPSMCSNNGADLIKLQAVNGSTSWSLDVGCNWTSDQKTQVRCVKD